MGEVKDIIILTESSKHSNYCVAGIDLENGSWVRIVSEDEDTAGALTDKDLTSSDGIKCQIFDKVRFPILRPAPTEIQPENYLIDRSDFIQKLGRASMEEVLEKHPIEKNKYLFGTQFNKVDHKFFLNLYKKYSLTIIEATNLEFTHKKNDAGKPKTKVAFDYLDIKYKEIAVTDSQFYCVKQGARLKQAYMVLSIGSAWKDKYHYLFAAKIFEKPE